MDIGAQTKKRWKVAAATAAVAAAAAFGISADAGSAAADGLEPIRLRDRVPTVTEAEAASPEVVTEAGSAVQVIPAPVIRAAEDSPDDSPFDSADDSPFDSPDNS